MHILCICVLYECSGDTLRSVLDWIRCHSRALQTSTAGRRNPLAPTATASCPFALSWHSILCSCAVIKESIQLKGHQIFAFNCILFPHLVHHMATETHTLSQRSGLCAGQMDYFWLLDAGMVYSFC